MIVLASVNPLFQTAAENTELGWLLGVMTLLFMAAFAGWTWYALNPSSRTYWEDVGRMPLDDGHLGGER